MWKQYTHKNLSKGAQTLGRWMEQNKQKTMIGGQRKNAKRRKYYVI
jgi:hypothetical protein